jgi:GxxExxY protein
MSELLHRDLSYAQLKGYLKITNLQLGLLLNFNNQSLQHDRYVLGSHPDPPKLQS